MASLILTERDRIRFNRFLKSESNGCLVFAGCRDPKGYGRFNVSNIPHPAHRVAFVLGGGVLTDEQPCVLHRCDNPPCCEFTHLFPGTVADNNADMLRKGRSRPHRVLPRGVVVTSSGRFGAQAKVDGINMWLGSFLTIEEAAAEAAAFRQAVGLL